MEDDLCLGVWKHMEYWCHDLRWRRCMDTISESVSDAGKHLNFKGLFGLEIMTIPTISVQTVPQKLISIIKYTVSPFQVKCQAQQG